MAHYEKRLQSQELYAGRILRLSRDTVELEDGNLTQREVVHHNGGAGMVPLTESGEVFLVRQFRYPFGRELLEIPAGKLEPGEDPLTAAKRELMEECGLEAGSVRDLGCIYPSVGYDTEVIYLYLARDLRPVRSHPDEEEFLSLERRPLKELVGMALDGTLRDAKTVAAVLKTALLLEGK